MAWYFAARERFGPTTDPEAWKGYLSFSGFLHIRELVSADSILCGDAIKQLVDQDWDHNIHADNRITLFTDYEYLVQRKGIDLTRHNILAILERPKINDENAPVNFEPCGFDILDSYDSVSVLTNCGKYPGRDPLQSTRYFGKLYSFSGSYFLHT